MLSSQVGDKEQRCLHKSEMWIEPGLAIRFIHDITHVSMPFSQIFPPSGCLGLVHWDDPEGWCGEGGGRRVQDGEHMYTCSGFVLMFSKTNTLFQV